MPFGPLHFYLPASTIHILSPTPPGTALDHSPFPGTELVFAEGMGLRYLLLVPSDPPCTSESISHATCLVSAEIKTLINL